MDDAQTLEEVIGFFADPDNCLNFLVARRWPDGVHCPICGASEVRFLASDGCGRARQSIRARSFPSRRERFNNRKLKGGEMFGLAGERNRREAHHVKELSGSPEWAGSTSGVMAGEAGG